MSMEPTGEMEDQAPRQAQDGASRRRMLIGVGGTVLVLLVVFWFLFTYVVDLQLVIDAVRSLTWWQIGILALMAGVTYVFQGLTLRNSLSGTRLRDATLAMQASLAVKGTIPGPMDSAFRFRLALAYGYSIEESTLSAATLKALDWLARLLMIPIAIGILLLSGQSIAGLELLAVIGLLISVTGIVLIIGVIRSERIAARIGDLLQRSVDSLMRRLHREPPHGLAERVLGLREMGNDLVEAKGLLGLGLQLVLQAAYASILTLALHFVGVDFDVLPISIVWATVAIVYALPIGPGIIEIAYMAIFGLAIGFDDPMLDLVAAGVIIFRILQWLVPIPIGYGLILWWQKRDRYSLLSADRADTSGRAAP